MEGFGGVGAGQVVIEIAVGGEEFFGTAVVGLEIGVGERPCRRDAVFVMEDAEVLGAEAEKRGSVDLGLASDEVGLLRVERLIVLVEPDVFGVVTVIEKDGRGIPVKFLLGRNGPRSRTRMRLPACARWKARVPPPAPVPMMMRSY